MRRRGIRMYVPPENYGRIDGQWRMDDGRWKIQDWGGAPARTAREQKGKTGDDGCMLYCMCLQLDLHHKLRIQVGFESPKAPSMGMLVRYVAFSGGHFHLPHTSLTNNQLQHGRIPLPALGELLSLQWLNFNLTTSSFSLKWKIPTIPTLFHLYDPRYKYSTAKLNSLGLESKADPQLSAPCWDKCHQQQGSASETKGPAPCSNLAQARPWGLLLTCESQAARW